MKKRNLLKLLSGILLFAGFSVGATDVKNQIQSTLGSYSVVLEKAKYDAKNGSETVWTKANTEVWSKGQLFNMLTSDFNDPNWAYMGYNAYLNNGTGGKKYLGWFGFNVCGKTNPKINTDGFIWGASFNPKGGDPAYVANNISMQYHNESGNMWYTVDGTVTKKGGSSPFPNTPQATPAVFPDTDNKIILNVSGNNIMDNKGNIVTIKGFCLPGLEWRKDGVHLSPQDIANIKKWKTNVVRISLNQTFWTDSEPATKLGSYKQIIDAIIAESIKNNMAVILDLHWTDEGAAINGQTPMADAKSLVFWKEVATTYKNFGTVMFELYNEPFQISHNVWLNGGVYTGPDSRFIGKTYTGYTQLLKAVRDTGAKNICIVNGLDWGYDLSFVGSNNGKYLIKDNNIVYGSHPYSYKGLNNTHKGVNMPLFAENFSGILNNHPIIFTEWGGDSDNLWLDHEMYSAYLQYMNTNNINYCGWAWYVDPSKPGFPCLISDWAGTPLNGGVEVSRDMQNKPGTVIGTASNGAEL